jgi:voltage-gated potassium channel
MIIKRRIIGSIIILLVLISTGVFGYYILLDLEFIDALYMTVITISTVGFQEVTEMTQQAKLFSIVLILFSIGTVSYLVTNIASYFIEGDIKEALKRRKMENRISKMNNHYIICGAGKTGHAVIDVFLHRNIPFVVIEEDEEKVNRLAERDISVLHGNATEETVLSKANITSAKGLVSVLPYDSLNLYVVLTAREMNQKLNIVAKAVDKRAHEKLTKAGANNTISPNEIAGRRMAVSLLRPSVISFLDSFVHTKELDLDLEDVKIYQGSTLNGLSLKDANIPAKTGLIILALKKQNEENLKFNPSSEEVLEIGDSMIVLGTEQQVSALQKLAMDSRND